MKRYLALSLVIMLLFTCPVFAASKAASDHGYLGDDDWIVQNDGDLIPTGTSDIGSADDPVANIHSDAFITNGVTIDGTGEGVLEFGPADFLINTPLDITASTAPGLEKDNNLVAIVWADGETTPAQVTFKVPSDYSSGGAFRLFCDESADTTRSQVDFAVYVNSDGLTWDSATSNQTPVALTELAGTAEQVTLTVATDFTALASGKLVTLNVWRDDTAAGTNDLELYYGEFYYTRTTE